MSVIAVSEFQFPYTGAETVLQLRVYCGVPFTASTGVVVPKTYVDTVAATVTSPIAVVAGVATVTAFNLHSTTNGNPSYSYYTFRVYDTSDNFVTELYARLTVPSNTPTTIEEIVASQVTGCVDDESPLSLQAMLDLLETVQDGTVKASTTQRGVAKSSYASVDVLDPIHVANNDPVVNYLRQRKYLRETTASNLINALTAIGAVNETTLVVDAKQQYTHTRAVVTAGPLVVGQRYHITEYPGVLNDAEIGAVGSGYIIANNVPLTGGSGTGATINITAVSATGGIDGWVVASVGSAYKDGDVLTVGGAGTGGTLKVKTVVGDDFENVGAAYFNFVAGRGNHKGRTFLATGTTPTTWTNGSRLAHVLEPTANIRIQFEGNGSLVADGEGAVILIRPTNLSSNDTMQRFVSQNGGKILVDHKAIVESNLSWWGGPTGTNDTIQHIQARDSLNIDKNGGRLKIPVGDWKTDFIEWSNYCVIQGSGCEVDGAQHATAIYPTNEAALYVGVYGYQRRGQGIVINDLLLSSNTSLTVNAFRHHALEAGGQNCYFNNVKFENVAATTGAVPLWVMKAERTFEEFANYDTTNCTWTVQRGSVCFYWEGTNTIGVHISSQFRANKASDCVQFNYTGFVGFIHPEFRGEYNPAVTPVVDRTIAGAASITSGTQVLNLTEDYTVGNYLEREDKSRLVRLPGVTFGATNRAFTFITDLLTPWQATLDETANSTVANVNVQLDEIGIYPEQSNACIVLENICHHVYVVGPSMEQFNYFLIDKRADYANLFSADHGNIAGLFKFEPGTANTNLWDCLVYSCTFNNITGNPQVRMFGGVVHNEIIPRYETVYPFSAVLPTWNELVSADAWHIAPNGTDFIFDSSTKMGARRELDHVIVRNPTRFVHNNSFGGPADTDAQVSILSPKLPGSPAKMLLRLGTCWPETMYPKHYHDQYRSNINGHHCIDGSQASPFKGIDTNGSLSAQEYLYTATDVLSDRDIIAQRGVRVATKATTSHGMGMNVGAGDTQTQITSKSTGVTSNALCGLINTHNQSIANGSDAVFRVTNSLLLNTDGIGISVQMAAGGALASEVDVCVTAAGYFDIQMKNRSGVADANQYYIRWWITRLAFS